MDGLGSGGGTGSGFGDGFNDGSKLSLPDVPGSSPWDSPAAAKIGGPSLSSFLGGGAGGGGGGGGLSGGSGLDGVKGGSFPLSAGAAAAQARQQGYELPGGPAGVPTSAGPNRGVGGPGEEGAPPMMPPGAGGGMGGAGAQKRERERTTWLQGDHKDWSEDDTGVSSSALGRS
jgi:hypothetical protein